jgi:hypothetical protein
MFSVFHQYLRGLRVHSFVSIVLKRVSFSEVSCQFRSDVFKHAGAQGMHKEVHGDNFI